MQIETNEQTHCTEIRLSGRFDRTTSREFREALIAALRRPQAELRISLAALDYIDSAALGMLLMAKEMAEAASKTVALENGKGLVAKAIDFARFGSIFRMV